MLQDFGRKWVIQGQLFQHFLVGTGGTFGGFFNHRQAQTLKKYLSNLLGRTQIEVATRQFMGLEFELFKPCPKLQALLGKCGRINEHPIALDPKESFAALNLQIINELQRVVVFQNRPQRLVHLQCHVHIFTSVLGCLVKRDLGKWDFRRALATKILIGKA